MKKLFYFFLPLLAFVACTDNGTDNNTNNNQGGGNQPVQNELTATPANLSFDSEEDSQTIDVYSTASWTAEFVNDRAKDWCSISPTNGNAGNSSILVSVKENTTGEERSASIVVKSGSLQKIVKVAQKQNDALTVTSSKFEVKAEGGEVEIEVKANIDYDYTIEESAKSWVKYKTTRAMETSTLVFDISENTSIDKREAKITFKSGNLKEVVTIYQDGTDYAIIISKDEYAVSDKGETITVEVKSNVDVVVEIPSDVDWVHENSSRAMSTNTYYFEISPNEDYNSRSTTIKFTNKENNLSESISITQAQKDAIVIAKDSYSLNDEGGNIDIEVGHNVDFDIEISDNWITQTTTRAFETETLRFNITANTSEDSREGTIKFISKDKSITQTVKVYQAQKDALIVSKKDITIDEQQQTVEFEVRANVDYTVSDPSASWLHREETRAMTSQTIRYTVDANTSYDSRTATITVQSKDGSLKETITITQATHPSVDANGTIIGTPARNKIFYTTSDRKIVTPYRTESFLAKIISNTYENGVGVIVFDRDITTIGGSAFFQCQNLKSIILPDGITEIGNSAFYKCPKLKSVTIPDSVILIGNSAFRYCSSFTSITIPDSVTEFGDYAFSDCSSLTANIIISNLANYCKGNQLNKIKVNKRLYINNVEVTNLTIPDSVTEIGELAFYYCSSITSITIPDSVTEIGDHAFQYCRSLKCVTIPDSVTTIGEKAFYSCSSLTSVTIPDSVIEIEEYAFYDCSSLTSVTIPDSVITIGKYTFVGCSSLTSITIPDSVTEIGWSAFKNCNSLTSIIIPDSVKTIEQRAFYGCSSLTKAVVGSGVKKIGYSAFEDCYILNEIICKPATPPSVILNSDVWDAFKTIGTSPKIYVPMESVDAYKSADGWRDYADIIVGIPN